MASVKDAGGDADQAIADMEWLTAIGKKVTTASSKAQLLNNIYSKLGAVAGSTAR